VTIKRQSETREGFVMPKFVIADDHVVLRQGLRALLNSISGWEVVGEASNGLEVIPLVEQHHPDVVILDLAMPQLGGIETISRLRKLDQKICILVLSAKDDDQSVREAMRVGANGFLPKTSESDELQFALNALMRGHSYLSPSVCHAVMANGLDGDSSLNSPLALLSAREREVMKLLSEGQPNRTVAKTLHISARTVDSHRANIMKKLGVNSNAELVQTALKHGLIE